VPPAIMICFLSRGRTFGMHALWLPGRQRAGWCRAEYVTGK
jgi:hypothetical protein